MQPKKASSTYEEFLLLMRAKGYEIKGETFGEDAPKFISFRPLGKDRFVRGSVKSLGKKYTKERIKERIEIKRERKAVIPKRDYANRKLVDTTDEKFQNSPELQRWAAIENLKIAAQAYNEAGSIKELEQKIAATAATGKLPKTKKHRGNVHNSPFRYGQRHSQHLEKQGQLSHILQTALPTAP